MSKELDREDDYLKDKQVNAPGTIGQGGKRHWIYPERRSGLRATRRKWVAAALIGFYLIAPWVKIGGLPLIRIDVIDQKAYLFGLVLKMTEYNYIFFMLAALALFLFLVTTLRGRIWCGYACPQTVFVEWVVRPIEEWFEGPARQRARQDHGVMTPGLLLAKGFKQLAFIAVALVVAHGFLGFFVDPRLLVKWVTSPPSEHPTAFAFVMFVTGMTYFDLSYFREQFCAFLCPYARFQSAMLDEASPSVHYDQNRGEPRGKGSGKGDCIDCGLCIRVCPTGIDIRNGLQLECIQCERCMDACDSIMVNLKRDPGLIRIASSDELAGKSSNRWLRPRVVIYSLLIIAVLVAGFFKLQSRPGLALTILRQTGVAYTTMPDGRLSNMFTMRANNTTGEVQKLKVELVNGDGGVELLCPTCGSDVAPYGEMVAPLLIVFPEDAPVIKVSVRVPSDPNAVYELPIIRKGSNHQ